jgi:hypothetical protein
LLKVHVYITFQEDRIGVLGAEVFGMADDYMWASDYAHGDSTWPRSRDAIRAQFEDLPDPMVRKPTWENAA